MPSPSELMKSLHSTLESTIKHADEIDELKEKHKNAEIQLQGTLKEYKDASARLALLKVELAQVEKTLEGKMHLVHDEQARTLKDVNNQIATAREELRLIKAGIKTKQAEMQNVLDGMEALQKRLRV